MRKRRLRVPQGCQGCRTEGGGKGQGFALRGGPSERVDVSLAAPVKGHGTSTRAGERLRLAVGLAGRERRHYHTVGGTAEAGRCGDGDGGGGGGGDGDGDGARDGGSDGGDDER